MLRFITYGFMEGHSGPNGMGGKTLHKLISNMIHG